MPTTKIELKLTTLLPICHSLLSGGVINVVTEPQSKDVYKTTGVHHLGPTRTAVKRSHLCSIIRSSL